MKKDKEIVKGSQLEVYGPASKKTAGVKSDGGKNETSKDKDKGKGKGKDKDKEIPSRNSIATHATARARPDNA